MAQTMKIKEQEALALRELLSVPLTELPGYSVDIQVQRRVGSILSGILKRHALPGADPRKFTLGEPAV
jgi:hypothetical protein